MKHPLQQALTQRGYTDLTPVQSAVTDPELAGRDLLVSAQTGSGKTVGFGLAIASTLLGDADRFGRAGAPLGLVIAPTRELALQVKRELSWLYEQTGIRIISCVGGMDVRSEARALAAGGHLIVATPGRLRDHIERGRADLSELRAVVLDEADEMLDLGFREDLEFILEHSPDSRQTLLFSATVPKSIAGLAKRYQRDAMRITTRAEQSPHADIEYRAMVVGPRDTEHAIINVLRYYEAPNAIIFANTRAMVARLSARLSNRGFSVVALSGELTQAERSNALQAMRDGRARICVATDVAARGIDLPGLDLVIHAELPSNSETLLHRSGRTGRAGRKGVSALIIPPAARKLAERLLRFAKLDAEWQSAPSAAEVIARDQERILADPAWAEPAEDSDTALAQVLVDRFSPEQLAAAFLRQYHQHHAAPEELAAFSVTPPKSRAREEFGPSRWFSLSLGRKSGADPRHLLPMICGAGDISREEIGAIRIQPDETYFELREICVADFLAAIGEPMQIEEHDLTALDAPPKLPPQRERSGGPGKFGKPKPHRKGPRPDHRKDGPSDHRKPNRRERDDAPAGRAHEAASAPRPKARKVWDDSQQSDAPGARKPGKPRGDRPTSGKPQGKPHSKPQGKPGAKPAGKHGAKPGAKPGAPKSKPDAPRGKGKPGTDPSKRMPPRKSAPRGGDAMPRRKKP